MKLYTSYFAQMRNFPKNLVGCSTALWNPKWLSLGRSQNGIIWFDIPPLKPGPSCEGLCRGSCRPKHPNDCAFLQEYRKQLDKIDIDEFLHKLENLKEQIEQEENLQDVKFALLVFETPQNPCSERVVIHQWLKDNGIEIKEWTKGE